MVKKDLNEKILSLGFQRPTLIQTTAYEKIKTDQSAVFISPTGTGKTFAYLIPLVEKIELNKDEVQVLIIVPTNELVVQTYQMFKELNQQIKVKMISAKDDRLRLIKSFQSFSPQVVISTPGRLLDLAVFENVAKVYTAKYLVLDEADMLFDLDFMSQLDPVMKSLTASIYIFSATMPKNLMPFINKYFGSVEVIDLTSEITLNIDHYLVRAGLDKEYRLLSLLEAINPLVALVFVSKNDEIEPLYKLLLSKGYNVAMLSSKLPIRQRKNIIQDVKQLKYQYVVASDIAARGLDFSGITHVINYQLPYKLEFYTHRSGRTGRMDAHGEVYSFYEDKLNNKFDSLAKKGFKFKEVRIKDGELITSKKAVNPLAEEYRQAIRRIKKPTKVKPGYKKKNKKLIRKALKAIRYKKGEK